MFAPQRLSDVSNMHNARFVKDRSSALVIMAVLGFVIQGASVSPAFAERNGGNQDESRDAITIDDLVRRTQIRVVALSQDGRYAAYLLVRGNPTDDVYELSIRTVDTEGDLHPRALREYRLSPSDTYTHLEWTVAGAGDLRWIGNHMLLFVAGAGTSRELGLWNAKTRQDSVILRGHDKIELKAPDEGGKSVTVVTTDFVQSTLKEVGTPADTASLVQDSYRFYGPLLYPKLGRRLRKQHWTFFINGTPQLVAIGRPSESWELSQEEGPLQPRSSETNTESFLFNETSSPDRKWVSAIDIRQVSLSDPYDGYAAFQVVARRGDRTIVLVPPTQPYVRSYTNILGWSSDSRSFYYLHVAPQTTTLNRVTLQGKIKTIWSGPALLEKPYPPTRWSQVLSQDGRYALLLRSTNLVPAQPVKIDLQTGAMIPIDNPNDKFSRAAPPQVRFYDVKGAGGDSWGRLYLPLNYRRKKRYPLLFTHYMSSPGFAQDVGDEIPILPVLAKGIAVFDMYSAAYSQVGRGGNFRSELDRVRKPLWAMQWIAEKLQSEGVVAADRVGLSGLSYGAEIAMYSYWNWHGLCAVSAASGSWEPASYWFGGPVYTDALADRGFPVPDETGLRTWRELTGGLNARADLPPLLLQSPEREQNYTVPVWTQLRRAGAGVEWYAYPDEGHVKVHPANKWWVFQRNLDWFRFWLKDEEDPDSSKAQQYARWRAIKGVCVSKSP